MWQSVLWRLRHEGKKKRFPVDLLQRCYIAGLTCPVPDSEPRGGGRLVSARTGKPDIDEDGIGYAVYAANRHIFILLRSLTWSYGIQATTNMMRTRLIQPRGLGGCWERVKNLLLCFCSVCTNLAARQEREDLRD